MAAPKGTALALCIYRAHEHPEFAAEVCASNGNDVEVFAEHMEDKVWCGTGPNRWMMAICREHGVPNELLDGTGDSFEWDDIFPQRVRHAAAAAMRNIHEYSRIQISKCTPKVIASAILDWAKRSTGESGDSATLRLFSNETHVCYSEHLAMDSMDVRRWPDDGHEVLHITLPISERPLEWQGIDVEKGSTWSDQLSKLQCDLDADEQFVHMVLSHSSGAFTLPAMYAAASYGAAISLPQPQWPSAILDMGLDSTECIKCGGSSCYTSDGKFSAMYTCSVCDTACHAKCGSQACEEHEAGASYFNSPPCDYHHGKVSSCYGLKKKMGCWYALLGPWPIADATEGIWAYHPVTLAHAISRASRCIGRSMWIPFTEPYAKPMLADAILANASDLLDGVEGKRARHKLSAVIGDVLWYGHVSTCDRSPDLGPIDSTGGMGDSLTCPLAFGRRFATNAPTCTSEDSVAPCLITSGLATSLLKLCVYNYDGYGCTYMAFRRLSEVTGGSLDMYIARWIAGAHPLVSGITDGPFGSCARDMHASVAKILSSSKVRRRALPGTQMSTWCIDTADPVFAKDPVEVLAAVAGDDVARGTVVDLWASRMTWMVDVPTPVAYMDVGVPCDPCVDLAVRFSLNFDAHKAMHRDVRTALGKAFSPEFADAAFALFESSPYATLPSMLDDAAWAVFRDRCVAHSEYGWLFLYMSTHGPSFTTPYSSPISTSRATLNPRLDPLVQRNVPWMGGWAQPRRLLEATDATLVDLGHGEAKYLSSLASVANKVIAFEIDLNAIRLAFANVKPRGSRDIHFVPVSWAGFNLSQISSPCLVAVAYRPGSEPPPMDHPRMHLLTVDCDTATSWGCIDGLKDTYEFADATGVKPGGAWRHRVSSQEAIDAAVDCFKLGLAMD